MTRFISLLLSLSLIFQPAAAYAQYIPGLNLPAPGAMVNPSPAFVPVLIKGLSIDPENPFQFEFIVDSGNSRLTTDEIKTESERLVKYFLASMTVPEGDLWVNLSPYEQNRIVPEELGKTDLGRDMLAQDYLLKQLTASMIDPQKELGKKFWERVRKLAQAKYGTTDIPMNSFNKVWILPSAATVFEKGTAAYVVESRLKVMTEEDYLAYSDQRIADSKTKKSLTPNRYTLTADKNSISTQLIRELIIPEIEKEVNTGRNFAPLRQIYNSLILAKWYKETIKETLLAKVYVDKNKIAGVDLADKTVKDKIYAQYVAAYKKGVFNYIKEDYDAASEETIPRKYFSGGLKWQFNLNHTRDAAMLSGQEVGNNFRLTVEAQAQQAQFPIPARGRELPSAPNPALAGQNRAMMGDYNKYKMTAVPYVNSFKPRSINAAFSKAMLLATLVGFVAAPISAQNTELNDFLIKQIQILKNRNGIAGDRLDAAKALGESRNPKVAPYLIDALNYASENDRNITLFEYRLAIANALVNIGVPAIPSVLVLVNHPDPDLQDLATKIFDEMRDSARQKLLELVKKGNEKTTRALAIRALGKLQEKRAIPILRELLQTESDLSVLSAVPFALGRIGDRESTESLIRLLKDTRPDVRHSAAQGLGWMKDRKAVQPLTDILSDPDFEVRLITVWALGNIRDNSDNKVTKLLIALFGEEKEMHVKIAILEALGKIADSEAVPFLMEFLSDTKKGPSRDAEMERRALLVTAVYALGKTGDSRAIPSLLKLLSLLDSDIAGDTDAEVREAIKVSLVNIGVVAIPHLLGEYEKWNYLFRADVEDILASLKWMPHTPREKVYYTLFGLHEPGDLLSSMELAIKLRKIKQNSASVSVLQSIASYPTALIMKAFDELGDINTIPTLLNIAKERNFSYGRRSDAANIVVKLGNKDQISRLKKYVEDDDALAELVKILSLGRFPEADTLKKLSEYLNRKINTPRDAVDALYAAEALGQIGDAGVEILMKSFRTIQHADVGSRILTSLAKSGNKQVVPYLIELFDALFSQDSSDTATRMIIGALGQARDSQAVPFLLEILAGKTKKYPKSFREEAANALAAIGDKEVIPVLLEVLQAEKSPDMRDSLIMSLGLIGDQRVWKAFREILAHKSFPGDVGLNMAIALFDKGLDQENFDLAITLLQVDEVKVIIDGKPTRFAGNLTVEYISQALVNFGLGAALPVRQIMNDTKYIENEALNVAAAYILGEIGDKTAIPDLLRKLTDKNEKVRESVANALDKLGWIPQTESEKLDYFSAKGLWQEVKRMRDMASKLPSKDRAMMGAQRERGFFDYVAPYSAQNYFNPSAARSAQKLTQAALLGTLLCLGAGCVQKQKDEPKIFSDQEIINLVSQLTNPDSRATMSSWPYNVLSQLTGQNAQTALAALKRHVYDLSADTDSRKWAFTIIGEIGTFANDFEFLITALESTNYFEWWHQVHAKGAVRHLIEKERNPLLIVQEVLDGPLTMASIVVLEYLYWNPSSEGMALLADVLVNHPDPDVREKAVMVTYWVRPEYSTIIVPALIDVLANDDDRELRAQSADVLGAWDDLIAVQPLMTALLNDNYVIVRMNSATSLGFLGDRQALPALTQALNDPNPGVRAAAQAAIELINRGGQDRAMMASPTVEQAQDNVGGIDMNKIDINKQGTNAGVEIKFNDEQMQNLLNGNFGGFAPVIINIVPIPSFLPMLGLEPKREEELQVSSAK